MAKIKQAAFRQKELIQAFSNGVHWGQVLRFEAEPAKGDAELFGRGKMSAEQLKTLAQAFEKLVTMPPQKLVDWTKNKTSAAAVAELVIILNQFSAPDAVRLPLNVIIAELQKRAGTRDELSARAVANLLQLNLQENLDGTLLQDLYKAYLALGLKVSFTQLGLPSSDSDLRALGETLAAGSGKGPFPANDAAYWFLSVTRIEMWGEKNSGHRDKFVLAKEMLQDPEIKKLLPALKALPPKRCAFVGYSMMMSLNWSTFGAWNDIAAETVKLVNPKLDYAGFQYGGIRAAKAQKELLPKALEYKPTDTYLLMALTDPADGPAFEAMIRELQKAGSTVHVVDEVRPWFDMGNPKFAQEIGLRREVAAKTKAHLLEFYAAGKAVPGHEKWVCLDQIHMVTDGHVFYAKELLKLWAAGK